MQPRITVDYEELARRAEKVTKILTGYGNPDALIGLERQLTKWGDGRDAH
jgi:hypothetical protein